MKEKFIANALSVDVEDYFQVAAFDDAIDRAEWMTIESRVGANTRAVLELFAETGTKATFFVLGWIAERHPELIRKIVAEGHEVACHGYSHKKIYTQSLAEFRQETVRAKGILEDMSGSPVRGYRAASFSITRQSMWALDVLVEQGFEYDSSIYPVHHDNYGIPGAQVDPHILATPAGYEIMELPLSSVGGRRVRLPVGGGGYFRLYPYWFTRLLLKRMNKQGRGFVFYCHPWEFDPDQPRVNNASRLSKFRHYNNLDKFQGRLTNLMREFEFTTCWNVIGQSNLVSTPAIISTELAGI